MRHHTGASSRQGDPTAPASFSCRLDGAHDRAQRRNDGDDHEDGEVADDDREEHLEVQSMKHSVHLSGELIKEIQLLNKYEFYLN